MKKKPSTAQPSLPPQRATSNNISQKSLLSKNVNEYTHFLEHPHTGQNDIHWILNLRNSSVRPRLQNIPDVPFLTYYKTTGSSVNKHTISDLKEGTNMSIFGGLVKKPIAHDTVNFSAGLRNSQSSMNERERRWNCIPSRDRSLFPRFLRKSTIKKLRRMNEDDYEDVYEGYLNYPNYEMKALKERNMNTFRHMARNGKSFQGLMWETSLRS